MPKRTDSKFALDEARAAVEEREVWHRRIERGQTVMRIAEEMGLSRSTVVRRAAAARARVQAETSASVEGWRTEQVAQVDRTIERMEVMILACVTEVADEDTGVVTRVIDHSAIARYETIRLAAIDKKAKLLGTYAVEKVEVTGTVTHVEAKDLELAAMLGVADEVKETTDA